jgi:hypothetical protein
MIISTIDYSITRLPVRISGGFTVLLRRDGSPLELTLCEEWVALRIMGLKEGEFTQPMQLWAHNKDRHSASA